MDLILLHGATGSSRQFDPLHSRFSAGYNLHPLNFNGHGGSTVQDEFTIPRFAAEVGEYIKQHCIHETTVMPVNVFGYSMGGYVAMYLARHSPQLVNKVVTLGTRFSWNTEVAEREIAMLNPEKIEAKVPAFAGKLAQDHGVDNWKRVLTHTAAMLGEMGEKNPLQPEDYALIKCPCLLMVGDRDKLVPVSETEQVYKQLGNAELAVLPSTGHALEQVNPELLSMMVNRFLQSSNK
ncbi:alpha/beta fold hydrolase [Segetibacter sp. 3557_3]|uniref:alpha/beta fold hydrolase n=1 Tax=Segetibacter sp. 3557_3 TaxID=2547429 RepID=UPI0010589B52|nr:alpha/beta fold hydrolase [Segetibacter sp. 3557_3]TDH25113.1 alpha/beta fold hydrolase [Segetibacter sp. 3557_3]